MTDPFDEWVDRQRVEPMAPPAGAFEAIARSAGRRRNARFAMTSAAVAVVVLAGGGLAYRLASTPPPEPSPAASATAPPERSAEPSAAGRPTGEGSRPPSGGSNVNAGPAPKCRTADLTVGRSTPGQTPGTVRDWIVFTNVTDRPCTLLGFPGVSWIAGPAADTVNKPAVRDFSQGAAPKVTLLPQQPVHAEIFWPEPGTVQNCNQVRIDGYRVYVPDEKASVFVAAPLDVCSTEGAGLATIEPVTP